MAIASSKQNKKSRKGQMKRKGESGAAKNYITRTQALKKLQCTLSDFRRLCILKGIYPREPRNRKKANRGSTVPSSFYYIKDIQYLMHEPILEKLREQKTFAKRLARAMGRKELGQAQRLYENRPVYSLDHVIKERYPTFKDALRDIDDALSLVILFANLPAAQAVNSTITENCNRLLQQWQLYIMKTNSLRKVFLSIKGVYYQAVVEGETITWLSPYLFTQKIPHDLDYRIMLTFIELYQALLGFVLYKLYNDANMVYPPKFDQELDEGAAGLSALILEAKDAENTPHVTLLGQGSATDPKTVSKRQLKQAIKSVKQSDADALANDEVDNAMQNVAEDEPTVDDFERESKGFNPDFMQGVYIFLSREVSRSLLEFVAASAGAQVGWDPILGAGSPFNENDSRITHHIMDRPLTDDAFVPPASHEGRRSYVQPQWLIDSVNRNTLLPVGDYAPGAVLPPHLSPFVSDEELRERGEYVPNDPLDSNAVDNDDDMEEDEDNDEDNEASEEVGDGEDESTHSSDQEQVDDTDNNDSEPENEKEEQVKDEFTRAVELLAQNPDDETLYAAAETQAELAGKSMAEFEAEINKAKKAVRLAQKKEAQALAARLPKGSKSNASEEERLASIMLTGSKKKLYRKMTHSKALREEQKKKIQKRRKALQH